MVYYYNSELYHHGVKGQKWGVRRYQNYDGSLTAAGEKRYAVDAARSEYKNAQNARKQAYDDIKSTKSILNRKGSIKSQKKYRLAELNEIDAKAKLKGMKSRNYDKAEFKTYRKEMQKSGIKGSLKDDQTMGRSTDLYNHIATKKGKEYADAVERSVKNRTYAAIIGGTALYLGSSFLSAYLN